MSGTAEAAELYSVIQESARLLDVACSREKVWPILAVYGDALAHAAPVAFRVATGVRHVGELDCRFVTHPKDRDPYPLALSNGLIAETKHPIGVVLSDIGERYPIDTYGIDFGVVGGFKKIYAVLTPDDLQKLSTLVEIPSMPPSLAENADFLTRHGLDDRVGALAIDYPQRTVNVYFNEVPTECFAPNTIRSIFREIGLSEPSEQLLKLAQEAFGLYVTLSWDSSKIERFSFGVTTTDLTTLPVRIEPEIERFVKRVPHGGVHRKFVYGVSSEPEGEYYKLESHYKWNPGSVEFI